MKSPQTVCYEILEQARRLSKENAGDGSRQAMLRVNPEIARAFKDEERELFRELEGAVGRPITVRSDEQLHHEQFDLMAI